VRSPPIIRAAALVLVLLADHSGAAIAGAAPGAGDVKLRGWTVGLQLTTGDRDRWDVFGRDALPPAVVEGPDRGLGAHVGRRFGGRFLLSLMFNLGEHALTGVPEKLFDGELLLTGTVLFNERGTWQPFVRGGLGGGALALEQPDTDQLTVAVGPAAIGGGGVQVRLSSRFSLELEAVARVTNFLEVRDESRGATGEEEWRVKTSHVGWRVGTGLAVWF
jgi:hypothetical protein